VGVARWTIPLLCMAAGAPAWGEHAEPGAARIPRIERPPIIDGRLDDPAWREALVLELRYETRPVENGPAPVRTRAFLVYDADTLYVAFDAEDPDPGQIRARLRDRDKVADDDMVGIVLDTFDDHRRAVDFISNPLGVQIDTFEDDVARTEDPSWDAIWDAAGNIDDRGYVVEFAIPMRALRFAGGGAEQQWAIDLIRFYPRDVQHRLSIQPKDRGRNCWLCQNLHLRGFEGISAGHNLELVPALVAIERAARPTPGAPLGPSASEVEPSLNLRWGITPNVILNAALHPDFSQVEADSAQLSVNTQFALFYPEKRPFFLEGADLFQTPIANVVYTRNLAAPDYGIKLSGKADAHAFGVFAADDQLLNLIFPASQGSGFGSFDLPTENQVLRYRRDLGEGSAVGALVARRAGDGYQNLVYGADTVWRFGPNDSLRAQALRSTTEYPSTIALAHAQPSGRFDDGALFVGYDRDTRDYWLYARHQDFGRGFRDDLGFVPQVDFEKQVLGGGRNWYPTGGYFHRFRVRGDWDITHDQAGAFLEREIEAWAEAEGRFQTFLELGYVARDQQYAGQRFAVHQRSVYGETTPVPWLSIGAWLLAGSDVDFDNVQAAEMVRFEPWFTLRPGRHLDLNLRQRLLRLDVAGGRLFTAELIELRATWQFSVRSYLRLISQSVDVERDPTLYGFPINGRDRDLANQLLFSYKVNPQTVFFLGYSDGHYAADAARLEQQERTLFLKLSYAWLL